MTTDQKVIAWACAAIVFCASIIVAYKVYAITISRDTFLECLKENIDSSKYLPTCHQR
jgi:hypothetical protein